MHVLVAKSNANSFTYDGIELGGERTANEIEAQIQELEDAGSKIAKLSIIGYSLGGLVARYAVGLLYSNKLVDDIQPVVCELSACLEGLAGSHTARTSQLLQHLISE